MPGDNAPVEVDVIDGALSSTASIVSPTINVGPVQIQDPSTTDKAKVVDGSTIVSTDIALAVHDANGVKDGGLGLTVTRTFSHAADGSTAFDITTAPGAGLKATAIDILISVATACRVTIQMETSGNILAGLYLPDNGSAQVTLRGYIKGDANAKKLQAKTSVASAIDVTAVYFFE